MSNRTTFEERLRERKSGWGREAILTEDEALLIADLIAAARIHLRWGRHGGSEQSQLGLALAALDAATAPLHGNSDCAAIHGDATTEEK